VPLVPALSVTTTWPVTFALQCLNRGDLRPLVAAMPDKASITRNGMLTFVFVPDVMLGAGVGVQKREYRRLARIDW